MPSHTVAERRKKFSKAVLNIKKGTLRKQLKTPAGEKIPVSQLTAGASQSKNELLRKRSQLALNFRKLRLARRKRK